jgi:hypothetical protein
MNKNVIVVLYLFLFTVLSLSAQNINVDFKEVLVLGADESAPKEYLFNLITDICTDSKGNIYIAEKKMAKVRVFDENGKFIKSIGRRGQGPGEMLEITCMTVDHKDELIVVDRMNRRFTRFSNMGDSTKTFTFLPSINPDLFAILALTNDTYVLYFRMKSTKNRSRQPDDKMLHIINYDFSLLQDSFAPAKDIWNFNEPFLRSLVGAPLPIGLMIIEPTKVVFTSCFYEGKLYNYELRNETWNLKILHGMERKYKSFRLLNLKDYKDNKYPKYSYLNSTSDGKFLVKMQNQNRGLGVLNDGKIVQFSFSYHKNKEKYHCELFDENGNFIGISQIKVKPFQIKWIDKNNKLYTKSVSKEGYSTIKVLKFEYSIK